MIIETHELVPGYFRTVKKVACDACGKEGRYIKKCYICDNDVCSKCAVLTDISYLSQGDYTGDYPDYFCRSCWERGEEYREKIFQIRDNAENSEDEVMEKWRASKPDNVG